jgi:hypothetical protein
MIRTEVDSSRSDGNKTTQYSILMHGARCLMLLKLWERRRGWRRSLSRPGGVCSAVVWDG